MDHRKHYGTQRANLNQEARRMMNVMIADDDRITREGICEFVDWKTLGLQVVATARDGQEALELLTHNDVDILITDIRMPYMTGFELVNAASSRGRFPATIIISGYDDYEYLQQAIKLHIILGYIFKPLQLDQLHQLLKEAIVFRKDWLSRVKVPELNASDHNRYSYKNIVVNLRNLEAIYQALRQSDLDRANTLFAQSWNNVIDDGCSLNFAKRYAWELSISLMQLLAKDGINAQDIVLGEDPLTLISALHQKQDIYALLTGFLENIHLYQQQHLQYQDPKLAYMQQALEQRYQESGLSLQSLAAELNVTGNYLGSLYKRERGYSFNTALLNRRMDCAKQLLVTTRKKVSDIASEVGITDSKYFAVTFRKVTNMTPSEYRSHFFRSK